MQASTEAMTFIEPLEDDDTSHFRSHFFWGGFTPMRAIFRPVLGIALAAAVAGCSHGASSVAPTGGLTPNQSQGTSQVRYFGQVNANAAQSCGAARPNEARCNSWVRTDVISQRSLSPNVVQGWHAADLVSAYKIPTTGGTGQIIAIVDAYNDPNAEADMGVYRSTFGLPACTTANGCFKKLNEHGHPTPLPPNDQSGWSEEESLDLDMASAGCPNCKIYLMEGNAPTFLDLATAVDSAVALGANVVSNSYGGGESGGYPYASHYTHAGHIITASSGDSGYAGGPQFPADVPAVVAVGGTSLFKTTSGRHWKETVWSGAGSGCSTVAPKPAWQTDPSCSKRTIADVGAVSDPNTGVAVYDTYLFLNGWAVFGGTSVAAPLVGSMYADAGNAGTLNGGQSLYTAAATALYDITSGSNGSCGGSYLCTAKPAFEYNGPTGNGTPKGTAAL
jgi:subtilase family serine protease